MKIKVRRQRKDETLNNLEERYKTLSEMLIDEDTDEETRKAVIEEMKFLKEQFPEKRIKPIEIGGIIGGVISGLFMIATAGLSYGLSNRGLFDKKGDRMLDPMNYKKL